MENGKIRRGGTVCLSPGSLDRGRRPEWAQNWKWQDEAGIGTLNSPTPSLALTQFIQHWPWDWARQGSWALVSACNREVECQLRALPTPSQQDVLHQAGNRFSTVFSHPCSEFTPSAPLPWGWTMIWVAVVMLTSPHYKLTRFTVYSA